MAQLKVVLASLIICFASFQSFGQKLAHVNRSKILQNMPQVQQARENLQKYSKELESQVQELLKEYRTKLKSFQEQSASMSQVQKNDRQRELKNLEERIQKFRQDAQKQVTQKQKELLQPIMNKVDNAIRAVAKRKGYVYVFDASQGSILYAKESRNITALVKQELNL